MNARIEQFPPFSGLAPEVDIAVGAAMINKVPIELAPLEAFTSVTDAAIDLALNDLTAFEVCWLAKGQLLPETWAVWADRCAIGECSDGVTVNRHFEAPDGTGTIHRQYFYNSGVVKYLVGRYPNQR